MPSLVGVFLFFFIPFLIIVFFSMIDNPISKNFIFADNFRFILENIAFQKAVKNTVLFSILAIPLAVLISMGMAIVLDISIPFRSTFRTFLLSPVVVPTASIVLIWKLFFAYNGSMNEMLAKLGMDKIDWFKSDYAMYIVILLFLWKNVGYFMVIFLMALNAIPKEYIEAIRLETSSKWNIFVHIKLRYLSSAIGFVTLLAIMNSFQIFREVYLLTGEYPYERIYMLQHFMNNYFYSLDYPKLSAAAILIAVGMLLVIGILMAVENYFEKDVEG